ncbi:hypothetical protein BDW71DRAFT_154123 [Aspergillus fruticulosus]
MRSIVSISRLAAVVARYDPSTRLTSTSQSTASSSLYRSLCFFRLVKWRSPSLKAISGVVSSFTSRHIIPFPGCSLSKCPICNYYGIVHVYCRLSRTQSFSLDSRLWTLPGRHAIGRPPVPYRSDGAYFHQSLITPVARSAGALFAFFPRPLDQLSN